MKLRASGIDIDVVMDLVSDHLGLDPAELSGLLADSRSLRRAS